MVTQHGRAPRGEFGLEVSGQLQELADEAIESGSMSASGTKRTSRRAQSMSAFGGKADIASRRLDVRY